MSKIMKSELLADVINSIYAVARRRTSCKFADESIETALKTLEQKYNFLKYVNVNKDTASDTGLSINVSTDIDSINSKMIGKAIESIIRVVYNDLNEEAGLYFITELKEHAGDRITQGIIDCEVDLDQVQIEQHFAYMRKDRKKIITKSLQEGKIDSFERENLLGYTWTNVSSWKHDPGSKYCTLYDKEGKVLDRLNLDRIIQNYVEKLSGYMEEDPGEIEKQTRLYEKEYKLLKLLLERDMDAETAMHILNISNEELTNMIRKLSEMEMLQYVSYDTIELTDEGINYLAEDKKTKKEE